MKICIISPRHISYNPRVVKEADALAAAGHQVTVIAVVNRDLQAQFDADLITSRVWRWLYFDYRKQGWRKFRWAYTGLRFAVATRLSRYFRCLWLSKRAIGREFPELRRIALATPADLYIAHHPDALPIAADAARRHRADYSYDAEDFHSGMDGIEVPESLWSEIGGFEAVVEKVLEWQDARAVDVAGRNIRRIESAYLGKCRSITAASLGIAEGYRQRYHLASLPTVVLNTFPAHSEDRPAGKSRDSEGPGEEALPVVRLYWYSQVIGGSRGLEVAARALALLPSDYELHLRGDLESDDFEETLRKLAGEAGRRLFLHPICNPDDLIAKASEFDIGLALETGAEINRLFCVTNKILTYLAAGLPVVANETPAQREIATQAHAAGRIELCGMSDPGSLANAVLRARRRAGAASGNASKRTPLLEWSVDAVRLVAVHEAASSAPCRVSLAP